MPFRVVYTPAAERHITEILSFVAEESSLETAERFVLGIVQQCDGLADLPLRGAPVRPGKSGVRMLVYRSRVSIAYAIGGDDVLILGVYYAGRNWRRGTD